MRSADVLAAIVREHEPPRWAIFPELAVAASGTTASRRIDAWAVDLWPSSHWRRVAYEIKVSRGDFRGEVNNPLKRREALLLSNEFVFAVPAGLVRPAEVPLECGLHYVHDDGTVEVVTPAPWRDTPPIPVRFAASIAGRAVATGERARAGLANELRDLRRQASLERHRIERLQALHADAMREVMRRAAHRGEQLEGLLEEREGT